MTEHILAIIGVYSIIIWLWHWLVTCPCDRELPSPSAAYDEALEAFRPESQMRLERPSEQEQELNRWMAERNRRIDAAIQKAEGGE